MIFFFFFFFNNLKKNLVFFKGLFFTAIQDIKRYRYKEKYRDINQADENVVKILVSDSLSLMLTKYKVLLTIKERLFWCKESMTRHTWEKEKEALEKVYFTWYIFFFFPMKSNARRGAPEWCSPYESRKILALLKRRESWSSERVEA